MADTPIAQTQSEFWPGCLMALSVLTGLSSLCFAYWEKDFEAFIAAMLSVFWGILAAGLLVFRSSARRMLAQLHERVVVSAMDCLVQELTAKRSPDAKDIPSRAELVDRLHGMAMKALDEPNRQR